MKKLKLKNNSLTKRLKPRTAAQKKAAMMALRKNRAARKTAAKSYYRKNKTEILKRAKARRTRVAKGDLRVTRKRSTTGAPIRIKLGDR